MFAKILFPTDFSDVSKKALNYVKRLQPAGTKQIIVLRVINERKIECICQGAVWCGVEAAEFVKQAYQNLTEEAKKELKPIESELKAVGFDVRVMVTKGVRQIKIL